MRICTFSKMKGHGHTHGSRSKKAWFCQWETVNAGHPSNGVSTSDNMEEKECTLGKAAHKHPIYNFFNAKLLCYGFLYLMKQPICIVSYVFFIFVIFSLAGFFT